ncbi:hypothetical protein Tco_1516545 [Tanacetum coccineum]
MHTTRGDGVAIIERRRQDLHRDGVRDPATTSGRGRLKEDLESSTWRRRQDFKATSSRLLTMAYTHVSLTEMLDLNGMSQLFLLRLPSLCSWYEKQLESFCKFMDPLIDSSPPKAHQGKQISCEDRQRRAQRRELCDLFGSSEQLEWAFVEMVKLKFLFCFPTQYHSSRSFASDQCDIDAHLWKCVVVSTFHQQLCAREMARADLLFHGERARAATRGVR